MFAPVAAHLCNGVELTELGTPIDPARLLPSVIPLPRSEGEALLTEVLWVDRFGNVELNVGPDEVTEVWGESWTLSGQARLSIVLDDHRRAATVVDAFDDLPTGALGLVVDSLGMYAVVMSRSSAAAELRLGAGDQVRLVQLVIEAPASTPVDAPITLGPRR